MTMSAVPAARAPNDVVQHNQKLRSPRALSGLEAARSSGSSRSGSSSATRVWRRAQGEPPGGHARHGQGGGAPAGRHLPGAPRRRLAVRLAVRFTVGILGGPRSFQLLIAANELSATPARDGDDEDLAGLSSGDGRPWPRRSPGDADQARRQRRRRRGARGFGAGRARQADGGATACRRAGGAPPLPAAPRAAPRGLHPAVQERAGRRAQPPFKTSATALPELVRAVQAEIRRPSRRC